MEVKNYTEMRAVKFQGNLWLKDNWLAFPLSEVRWLKDNTFGSVSLNGEAPSKDLTVILNDDKTISLDSSINEFLNLVEGDPVHRISSNR